MWLDLTWCASCSVRLLDSSITNISARNQLLALTDHCLSFYLSFYKVGQPPLYVTFSIHSLVCPFVQAGDIARCFFHFFEILIFWVVRRVKVQKTDQKWQKIVALHFSGSLHDMMSFVTHKCKMMISPDCFFIFSKCLIFLVVRRLKGQKMAQNDKMAQNSVCCTLYVRNCTTYDCGFWNTCVKWYLQQVFSFFQNFDFSGFGWML